MGDRCLKEPAVEIRMRLYKLPEGRIGDLIECAGGFGRDGKRVKGIVGIGTGIGRYEADKITGEKILIDSFPAAWRDAVQGAESFFEALYVFVHMGTIVQTVVLFFMGQSTKAAQGVHVIHIGFHHKGYLS